MGHNLRGLEIGFMSDKDPPLTRSIEACTNLSTVVFGGMQLAVNVLYSCIFNMRLTKLKLVDVKLVETDKTFDFSGLESQIKYIDFVYVENECLQFDILQILAKIFVGQDICNEFECTCIFTHLVTHLVFYTFLRVS